MLEFCDAVSLVVTNTWLRKEANKLVTYVSGDDRSVTDYLLLRRCDRGVARMRRCLLECVMATAACGQCFNGKHC